MKETGARQLRSIPKITNSPSILTGDGKMGLELSVLYIFDAITFESQTPCGCLEERNSETMETAINTLP